MDAPVAAASRPIDLASEPRFRVGAASIDPVSREARFGDSSERIQPQNLKVLIALARHRGEVVTRDQLVDLCWDGRFVGDDVINRAISTLRQFADRAGGFGIETVPRAGYRLVEAKARKQRNWRRWAFVAAGAIVLLGLLLWFIQSRNADRAADRTPTIALLPFRTVSGDLATRELATAAHDSIAHTLSQTQFRVVLMDAPPQGSAADFVISGDISNSGGSLIAMLRMEETAHHTIVYSQRFEAPRDKWSKLIDQIGGQVAGSIGWTVPLLMLDRDHRLDPAITSQLFRKTDSLPVDNLSTYEGGRRLAESAPDSPLAQLQFAIGAAFALPDLPREQRPAVVAAARRAGEKAHALAPTFGEPFISWCVLHSPARIRQCEDHLRAGMRADPDSPFVDWYLANKLMDAGRFADALDLAKQSLAHDQFQPEKISLMLRMLDAAGNSANAEEYYRQIVRWWPDYRNIMWSRASGMIDRGDYAAIERYERQVGQEDRPLYYEPLAPAAAAARTKSLAAARRACPLPGTTSLKTIFCINVLAAVGDLDGAFAIADRLYPTRGRTPAEQERIWLDQPFMHGTEYLTGPGAAALRRDPRYLALAERTGLLAYWRSGRLPDFCRGAQPEPICSQLRPR
jgi:DNA-binding winged helix-turn-helix (wHTH) protein/TolB-like protein/tetratricopeptide (TPR) repeat protein